MVKKQLKLKIVPRRQWGADPPTSAMDPLPHPVQEVLLTSTDTMTCNSLEECSNVLQDLQGKHMADKGLPDIAFNFFFGSDRVVYEGRGWHTAPSMLDPLTDKPQFVGRSIIIAYIGDYTDDNFPEDDVLDIKDMLVQHGIANGFIREFPQKWYWEEVEPYDDETNPVFVTAKLTSVDPSELRQEY